MRTGDLGYNVGELQAMLVRLGGSRQGVRHTVTQYIRAARASSDAYSGRTKICSGDLQIAPPLEAHVVHHRVGDGRVPIGDEYALLGYVRAVVTDRFVRVTGI